MRQVISRSYCLPPDIIKWLEKMSHDQTMTKRRYISASSILSDMLVELKHKKTSKK